MVKKKTCEACGRTDCPGWNDGDPFHEYKAGNWTFGCHCEACSNARTEAGGFIGLVEKHNNPTPNPHKLDVDAIAKAIVTAACELDGPADPEADDTISIKSEDLEAVVHRHVTAALEGFHG